MNIPQTIEAKKLWCPGYFRGFDYITKRIHYLECNHQNECPCYESNKTHNDYAEPMKISIRWWRKEPFINCEFYKLK